MKRTVHTSTGRCGRRGVAGPVNNGRDMLESYLDIAWKDDTLIEEACGPEAMGVLLLS